MQNKPTLLVTGTLLATLIGCAGTVEDPDLYVEPEEPIEEVMEEELLDGQAGVIDEEEDVFEDEQRYLRELDAPAGGLTAYPIYLDPMVATACNVDKNKTFFEFNSAKLAPEAKQRLDQIAQCLENGALQNQRVALMGHADPRGREPYNYDLARQRAEKVAQYLHRQGIPPGRMDVVSLGEKFARAGRQNYQYDRRVAITVGNPYGAFNAWDMNRNQRTSKKEFQRAMPQTGAFTQWDRNRDQQITQDEFANTLFLIWNIDRAGGLSEEEFKAGANTWFGDEYLYDFNTWDLNDNYILESNEFITGFDALELWNDWDIDNSGGLTESEWNEGLYKIWDIDQDGFLSEEEFYGADYGGWSWRTSGYDDYPAWDTDQDSWLSEEEFTTGFGATGVYNTWNTNNDEYLTVDEFSTGLYDLWDVNGDNILDINEWDRGRSRWFPDYGYQPFSDWDTNADTFISRDEWNERFRESGWFEQWDANNDTYLYQDEYNTGLYGIWDVNNDGVVDYYEYTNW